MRKGKWFIGKRKINEYKNKQDIDNNQFNATIKLLCYI